MSSRDLAIALWPRSHPPLLQSRRATTLSMLAAGFAGLFAVLTLAWIAMDVVAFPADVWMPLALARLVAAGAFLAIALGARRATPSLAQAHARLFALCAIPAAFFAATHGWVSQAADGAATREVAAVYALVPIAIAGGLALFPLTALESAAYWLLAFGLQSFAAQPAAASATPVLQTYWMLVIVGGIAAFSGMTQVRLLAALVRQATRDPLTGCLRRESGRELLDHQFRLAQRQASPFAVLFADLDHFKAVNDTWGHDAGDAVLARAAATLRRASRRSDTVLRWGGEEFIVLLPDATAADALRLVERLREAGAVALPDGSRITLSIGIAERLKDGIEDPSRLVDLADRRMYLAKGAGRNRWLASDDPRDAAPLLAANPE
jgi:diguanylate cyclase (GGDEF)-like protein